MTMGHMLQCKTILPETVSATDINKFEPLKVYLTLTKLLLAKSSILDNIHVKKLFDEG